jgi:hypothetical protein
MCAIPPAFQAETGCGPYGAGWGGYHSLMNQCLTPVSLGGVFYALSDPHAFADGSLLTAGKYKVGMDHSSGSVSRDWYPQGSPSAYDRGVREATCKNDYDGGNWLSPAPDGKGRQPWGDSYYNCGMWIDGPTKHGFVAILSSGTGRVWYEASNLHSEGRAFEIQIFDPVHLGECMAGTRPPWAVQPTSNWSVTLPNLGGGVGGGHYSNVLGATFDATTNHLYLMGFGTNGGAWDNQCCLYDFAVST